MSAAVVRVVHVMRVLETSGPATWMNDDDDNDDAGALTIGERLATSLFSGLRAAPSVFHEGYEWENGTTYQREYVLQSEGEWHKTHQFRGEHVWARDVEQDEIFVGVEGVLLLRRHQVIELIGDFAIDLFSTDHALVLEDGLEHLEAKAYDFLLEAVGNDYEMCFGVPWPDELFDIVVREIQTLNLVEASATDILGLAEVVVQQIPPPTPS